MLVATALGVFIIPGNYTFIEGLGRKRKKAAVAAPVGTAHAPAVSAQAAGGHSCSEQLFCC
jgi:hypothetical protein